MRISDWSSDVCSSDLLSDASALDPDDAGAFVYRGQVYSKKKRFSDALADFDRAVLLAPKSPWPFNNRGLAHADSGDYAAAVIDYRSEEHTSELQSLMRISYAVFCLKKKKTKHT